MLNKVDALAWVADAARTEEELRRACLALGLRTVGDMVTLRARLNAQINTLATDATPSGIDPANLPAIPAAPRAPAAPRPWWQYLLAGVGVLVLLLLVWAIVAFTSRPTASPPPGFDPSVCPANDASGGILNDAKSRSEGKCVYDPPAAPPGFDPSVCSASDASGGNLNEPASKSQGKCVYDAPAAPPGPVGNPPPGWTEVEHDFAGGLRRVYNHDMDGRTSDVFLTWYFVETLDVNGNVVENLGQCALRVTVDPEGEKVATQGGWRRFRWESGTPGKTDIETLLTWWVSVLESEPGGACSRSGAYTVSWQTIVNAPSAQQAGGEPVGWTEIPEMFKPAGDILISDVVSHGNSNMVTIAWFWAGPGPNAPTDGCTIYVITNEGQSNLVFQGAHRTWQFSGNLTAADVQMLVRWWVSVLEDEPRGGCAHEGAYSVLWQDANLAPSDPRGRP